MIGEPPGVRRRAASSIKNGSSARCLPARVAAVAVCPHSPDLLHQREPPGRNRARMYSSVCKQPWNHHRLVGEESLAAGFHVHSSRMDCGNRVLNAPRLVRGCSLPAESWSKRRSSPPCHTGPSRASSSNRPDPAARLDVGDFCLVQRQQAAASICVTPASVRWPRQLVASRPSSRQAATAAEPRRHLQISGDDRRRAMRPRPRLVLTCVHAYSLRDNRS